MRIQLALGALLITAASLVSGAAGAGKEAAGLRRQRRVRFLEAGRGRRQEGAGRTARTTSCSSNIPRRATAALQNALMDDLVAAGTDAIMVSSVDPEDLDRRPQPRRGPGPAVHHRQRRARSRTASPISARRTPTPASRPARSPLKALPDGGKCMGFVGFLGADNAVERIAGFRKAVEGSKDRAGRRARRRHRLRPRPAQCRRRAGRQPRHQLHGRLLLLQPAARSTRR